MTTKMQFETMAKVLPFAAELLNSTPIKDFKAFMNANKAEDISTGAMMERLLPLFLSEKSDVLFGLFGALSGKTAAEVADQDWDETKKLLESPILEDLFDFFIFSIRMVRTA